MKRLVTTAAERITRNGVLRSVALAIGVLTLAVACRQSVVKRVLPGVQSGAYSELSESVLASILVCNDSLGLDAGDRPVGRCLPCIPLGATEYGTGALKHARALWAHTGRAPHDTAYRGGACASLAFDIAKKTTPDDLNVDVEYSLFRLASSNDSVRALGLARMDHVIDSLLSRNEGVEAERLLGIFARGIWERSERMLERPASIPLHEWERDAHRLTRGAPPLRQLPAIPRTSDRFGQSEAEWSARLFDRVAALSADDARRSSWHRLALAPWVVMGRWRSLDSAANALLVRTPNDSTVLPARALAAFRLIGNPVQQHPVVMAAFDTALRYMPRADSLEYDSFDDLLKRDDDEWRYGFLPSDRLQLDRRGWVILDPLWSTPVNELRLAKRARVAEANYRYAADARAGQSGVETAAGRMLLRRGAPDSAWSTVAMGGEREVRRGWLRANVTATVDNAADFWRATYGAWFSANRLANWSTSEERSCRSMEPHETLVSCIRAQNADWTGTTFWGQTDTIDVTVARFRVSRDSSDMYVGARLPLRRFKAKNDRGYRDDDRIEFGLFITSDLGAPVFHRADKRALPDDKLVAWTAQWDPRLRSAAFMHRVEAMEPSRPSGARGAVIYTSDAALNLSLTGFGISDLLVAAEAREQRVPAQRWRDLALTPNGGVIAPRAKFALGWEIYDLTPAPDGRVRWRVSVRRENGEALRRPGVRALMAGARNAGDRVLANEPGAPAVSYTRDANAAPALLEHIKFDMGDLPPGRHVVEVRIDDLVGGRSVSRSVLVRVLEPAAQRRGTAQPGRSFAAGSE